MINNIFSILSKDSILEKKQVLDFITEPNDKEIIIIKNLHCLSAF